MKFRSSFMNGHFDMLQPITKLNFRLNGTNTYNHFMSPDNRELLEKIAVGKRNCLIIPDEICDDHPSRSTDRPMVVWNPRHLTRLDRQLIAIRQMTSRDDSPNISSDAFQSDNEDYQLQDWVTMLTINPQTSSPANSESVEVQHEQSFSILDSDNDDLATQRLQQSRPDSRTLCLVKWIKSILMNILLLLFHWSGLGNAGLSNESTTINSGQNQKKTPQVAAKRRRATDSTAAAFRMKARNQLRRRTSKICSPQPTHDNKRAYNTRKVNRTVLDVGDWRRGGNERVELIRNSGVYLWKKQLIYIHEHHDDDPRKLARGLVHGIIPLNVLKKMTVSGIGKGRIAIPSPILDAIQRFINEEIPDKNFTFGNLKDVLNNHLKTLRV